MLTVLRIVMILLAIEYFVYAILMLFIPIQFTEHMGFMNAPEWFKWLAAMLAGNFLGLALGLAVAVRDPYRNVTWVQANILLQAVHSVWTFYYYIMGTCNFDQIGFALILAPLWTALLVIFYPTVSMLRYR